MSRSSIFPGSYPNTRMRRIRSAAWSRDLFAENALSASDLILAVVVKDGENIKEPIDHLPGIYRHSPDQILEVAKNAWQKGIKALALFPYTDTNKRTDQAEEALNPDNLMCRTARLLKQEFPQIGLIGDVALDPYTSHGHDGVLNAEGYVTNDATNDILCKQALIQAQAGFDVIAPSDMMDGRIGIIRQVLEEAGLVNTQIMSYAVKYASCFYGPYRGAIGSKGVLQGDKKTYQMNPANSEEGLREVALDLDEGADSVMIKPGMPYLDMVTKVKQTFGVPTVAFQVSGEYAMLSAAIEQGALEEKPALMEALMCFKRAGADAIITYYADRAATWLQD